MKKVKVAVLGATGMIGQRFIQMLEGHPYFEMEGLYASERSDGKKLADVLKVRDHDYVPETLEMTMETMDISEVAKRARVAFVGLPSDLAGPTETQLAESGVAVFTNAGAHRMDPDVPILIPEINPGHLEMVKAQKSYGNGGFIVANANCSTTGAALPLAAIEKAFGLNEVYISTYQALSGAGYPGVPSLDAVGNVVPYIGGEEEKVETELAKILGNAGPDGFEYAKFGVFANCARVPVIDGHMEALVIKTGKKATVDAVVDALEKFAGPPQELGLPSAPEAPIVVRREQNRPQPALDSFAGGTGRSRGMSVSVGRVREKDGRIKLFLLSHNTLRGGSGGSVLNAELALRRKYL
ncbi:MAG: aspartate-semialdehyde dehydrogenase [Thermoplasmatales archaeon]|nr:aspartate-semialdehyde dehydrogenase [Thermoplasmatales archaeon]